MGQLLRPKGLFIILLAALAVRTLVFAATLILNPDGFMLYDSYGYWQLGHNLIQHGSFSQDSLEPDYMRTPVYPLMLGALQWLGIPIAGTIVCQLFLSCITVLYTFAFARFVSNQMLAAYLAAGFFALDIPSVIFANTIHTETLFTCLLTGGLYHTWKSYRHPGLHEWFAGLFLGLAVLCRPIAVGLPLLLGLVYGLNRQWPLMRRLRSFALVAGISYLVTGIWVIRNYSQFDRPFLSMIGNFDLFYYHAADVIADRQGISIFEAQRQLEHAVYDAYPGDAYKDPIPYFRHQRDTAIRILAGAPITTIKNQLLAAVYLFTKPLRSYIDVQFGLREGYGIISTGNVWQKLWTQTSGLTLFLVGWQWLLLFPAYWFGGYGLWNFYRSRAWIALVFFGIILGYFAILTCGPVTDARFRVPIVPVIGILAGLGSVWRYKKSNIKNPTS